jgi:excisionase family DNA binding protein
MEDVDRTELRLLRPGEVAELLGVSRSWLYAAAQEGRIPCVRLGGADGPVRFRRDALEAWIASGPRREQIRKASTATEKRRPPRPRNADPGQLRLMLQPKLQRRTSRIAASVRATASSRPWVAKSA